MTLQRTPPDYVSTPLRKQGSASTLRIHALMEKQQRIEIGRRIWDLREASPQTNRSIGDYVGVGERSVANWVSGDTGITYENAKKVAELFGVDVNWLWSGKETGPTPDLMGDSDQLNRIEAELHEVHQMLRGLAAERRAEEALAQHRPSRQAKKRPAAPKRKAAGS